jgi:hypothetical protein
MGFVEMFLSVAVNWAVDSMPLEVISLDRVALPTA